MTDTKKTPAWAVRKPLDRATVAHRLNNVARERAAWAAMEIDQNVKDGITDSVTAIELAAEAVAKGWTNATMAEHMADYASARYGCAKASGTTGQRAAYMDASHLFSEAARYLRG